MEKVKEKGKVAEKGDFKTRTLLKLAYSSQAGNSVKLYQILKTYSKSDN